MKPSGADRPAWALLGIAMLAALGAGAAHRRMNGAELERFYQCGYARPAVALLPLADIAPVEAAGLVKRLNRANVVFRFDPEKLRATPAVPLVDDGTFWPAKLDLCPRAGMRLRWDGAESGELAVSPEGAPAWKVALRSKEFVRPAWSAFSGLIAYYDMGRVWIADVRGRRFQSVSVEPRLEDGGNLKFSADGTALEFYSDRDRTWKAQFLYVLKGR